MNIAGVDFSESDCELLEELAADDMTYTMGIAVEHNEEPYWRAVEDCYRVMDRVAHDDPSPCDLMVLADLAYEASERDGSQLYRLACKLVEAYELLPYQD